MNKDLKYPLNIQLFGEEAPAAEEETQETPKPAEKTFSQAEVDKLISDRLAREKGSNTKTPPEAVDEPDTGANDALVEKYVNAELKLAMTIEGIDPSKVNRAVRLLDPSAVLNEAGEMDSEKVSTQISELLKEWPELKVQGAQEQRGFRIGSDNNSNATDEDALAKAFGNL